MNRTSLAMVIPLVLLAILVTTPSMITEDVFARYQRHTDDLNQAASISNSCLNPVSNSNTNDNIISNGNCGGTISQQGRSGQASTPTTVQNANPNIEVQRSTTPGLGAPPPTTGTLTLTLVCSNCGIADGFNLLVTDGSGNSFGVQLLVVQKVQAIQISPGSFTVVQESIPGVTPSFSGGCTGTGNGIGSGVISAGQNVTCTITENIV